MKAIQQTRLGSTMSLSAELKRMLEQRRRELRNEVQGRMRDLRADGAHGGKLTNVLDAMETSDADIQEDLECALIQMKSEMLSKVDDVLARLDQGDYGTCIECGKGIGEKRLRALPFAINCKDCEEAKEIAEQRERQAGAALRRR